MYERKMFHILPTVAVMFSLVNTKKKVLK